MKIINLIYKSTFCAILVVGMSSCVNNWLDESPSDSVEAGTAIQTSTDLTSVRTGMYAAFKGTSNFTDYYAQTMFVYGDVRGEDIQYNATYGSNRGSFYYYMNYTTADQFTRTNGIWQSPFIVMGRANRLIEAANSANISDRDDAKDMIAQYKAEAQVLRAYCLFDLTRVYGKTYTKDNGASLGVPIDTASMDGNTKLGRNTVAECYTQVLKDLNAAISSGALTTEEEAGYVNVWAAKALLVRVYLTMGNYDKVIETADDIINNGPFKLWTTDEYADAWNENNGAHLNEIMFELGITNSTDWTDRNGIAYLYSENGSKVSPGYGDLVATKSFVDMLTSDPTDVRNNVFRAADADKSNVFNGAKVYLTKFPAIDGDVRYDNVPMLRLSEVYLSAAEAAFNKGLKDKAADYLNAIIKNRTTDVTKLVTSADITSDRIYIERRKELVGEGQRFFDAMRRGETITRYAAVSNRGWHDILEDDARSYDNNSTKAVAAIPQYEINANPNMVQNPGYGQ
jgi:tetratricopeptide (TPR) repeat protein